MADWQDYKTAGQPGALTNVGAPPQPQVYTNTTSSDLAGNMNPNVTGSGLTPTGGDPSLTDVQAYADYIFRQLANDPQATTRLQNQLTRAGYFTGTASGLLDQDTTDAYFMLLADVYTANQAGTVITPEAYLQKKMQEAEESGLDPTGAGTFTSTSVDLSAGQDAHAAAESAFQSLLGRNPRKKDVAALRGALNAYERAHATTTTRVVDAKGNSTSTTSGGAGTGYDGTMAEKYVTDNHGGEAAGMQITRLADVFSQMLAG